MSTPTAGSPEPVPGSPLPPAPDAARNAAPPDPASPTGTGAAAPAIDASPGAAGQGAPPSQPSPRPGEPPRPAQGVSWAPPLHPQPPTRRAVRSPEGSFGRGFGVGVGVALGAGAVAVALSLVSLLALVAGSSLLAGATTTTSREWTTIWGPESAANVLKAIPIRGAIQTQASDGLTLEAGVYGYELAELIDAVTADDAAGLVLLMDTPGGTITGAKAISDAVVRYQERTGKKVFAFVEGMSASGGMYAMAPADRIVADYGTLTGSIGVIYGPFSRYRDVTAITGSLLSSGVETTGGITQEYFTQGTGKDMGNPFRDLTDEERAVTNEFMKSEYDAFVQAVSTHRDIPAATIVNEIGAHVYGPQAALGRHLIDAIAGRDDAMRQAADLAGVDPAKTRIEAPTSPSAWQSLLGATRMLGYSPAATAPAGQQVRASSVLCGGAPHVLAWTGDTARVCG